MGFLPLVALGLGLVGTAGQVLSERGAAESEAQAAELSAQFSEIEAASIEDATRAEEEADRRRTDRILGKLRATGAASGVDITSGSALLLELDSAKEAELSALTVRQRGAVGAVGKRQEAALSRRQAQISRGRKGAAIGKGILRGASLLTEFAGPSFFTRSPIRKTTTTRTARGQPRQIFQSPRLPGG